jgi:hypothetical protein
MIENIETRRDIAVNQIDAMYFGLKPSFVINSNRVVEVDDPTSSMKRARSFGKELIFWNCRMRREGELKDLEQSGALVKL